MIEKGPGNVALIVGCVLMVTSIISRWTGWDSIANVTFFASAVPILVGMIIRNS